MNSDDDLASIGKALVETARDVVVVIQGEKVVFANRAAAELTGVSVDQLIGTDFVDFLPGEDRAGHLQSAREMLNREGSTNLTESRVVTGDGSMRDLEAATTTISYRNQPAFLVIARDITARKQAEEQLKETEERYRFLFNNSVECLLVQEVNPDGSPGPYVDANEAVCNLLGYTREEILELDLTDFASPELFERLPEIARSLLKAGHAHFEADYFAKDGRRIPSEVFLHALDLQGKKYVLSNARDLREKIRSESELRSSELRYRMVLDSAKDAIMVHEVDENGLPGRFVEVNRFACEEIGYSREEMLGMTPMDIAPIPPAEGLQLKEVFAHTVHSTVESVAVCKNGRHIPVEVNAHLFNLDGKPLVVSVARNISERKRTETELRAAKNAAEKANQAKTAFLANVSHELRTPLSGVLGLSEILLGRELDPDVRDPLTKIRRSAKDLQALIEDLLDLSVIEAGKLRIKDASFELAACVEDATTLASGRFQEKGLSLDVKMDARLPSRVTTDRTRIRQLLSNLLDNALKFTQEGGVVVGVGMQDGSDGSATILFSVEDSGIGVPPKEQDAIFEKFVRLDNPINRVHGGTGLGLAICKQLVEQMGGQLGLSPRPGGGSRFWFSLKLPAGKYAPALC